MRFKLTTILIICLLIVSTVNAEDENSKTEKATIIKGFKNAVNTCPGGYIFGVYSLNYTRLLAPRQSLAARFDFENISEKYSGDEFGATGLAFILNYRRHLKPSLKSFYVGTYTRFRKYDGSGEAGLDDFDFDISEFTVGLNVGKRWVWSSGFNINFMLGYGYAWTDEKLDPENSDIKDSYDNFKAKYDFEGPMLGEFSIGYAF